MIGVRKEIKMTLKRENKRWESQKMASPLKGGDVENKSDNH
jgi:hypothetical protein